jgi:hypothetical protein
MILQTNHPIIQQEINNLFKKFIWKGGERERGERKDQLY